MKFLDTPNPNAKKVLIDHKIELSIYLDKSQTVENPQILKLLEIDNIESIFTGPGFITITKFPESSWENIIQDFNSKVDNI